MNTQEIYDAWQEKLRTEGELKGRAEGELKGRAEGEVRALLAVLEARGLTVSASQAQRIRGCRDPELLERWLRRAVSAASCDEVLA